MDYNDFLTQKRIIVEPAGKEVSQISPILFDFQRDITDWAPARIS